MDTSKEYIKMCEEAYELQSYKNEKQHWLTDFVFHDFMVKIVTSSSTSEGGCEYECSHYVDDNKLTDWFVEGCNQTIWLPRQDQIQEAIIESERFTSKYEQHQRFTELYDLFDLYFGRKKIVLNYVDSDRLYECQLYCEVQSYEKLWLMCYMYYLHQKVWNHSGLVWQYCIKFDYIK